MKKFGVALLTSVTVLLADPSVHSIGIGTRSFGMANNVTAIANDFSALFWNPAGLAFVLSREAHCGYEFNRQSTTTDLAGTSTSALDLRSRLSSAGLMQSVPTVRGGFGLAIGYSSPYLLDDLNNFKGTDIATSGDIFLRDRSDHRATGQLNLWSGGVGWQIAPGLGFGLALGLLTGSEKWEIGNAFHHVTGDAVDTVFDRTGDREYLGYNARIGLLYFPIKNISIGCRLEIPSRAKLGENYSEIVNSIEFDSTKYGVLLSPFSGAIGAAFQLSFATISSDLTFRAPLAEAPVGTDGRLWKGGAGIGVEMPLRKLASMVRGGFSLSRLDLNPMQLYWDGAGIDPAEPYALLHDNRLVTVGYSAFLGNSVTFDIAYGWLSYAFTNTSPNWITTTTERHSMQRGMMTLSIRY